MPKKTKSEKLSRWRYTAEYKAQALGLLACGAALVYMLGTGRPD